MYSIIIIIRKEKKIKIRIGKKSTVNSRMDGTRSRLLEINTT